MQPWPGLRRYDQEITTGEQLRDCFLAGIERMEKGEPNEVAA